jgi:hypothetical protein
MNTCIGAKNEFLYLLFDVSFLVSLLITIVHLLLNHKINNFIKTLVIILNVYISDRVFIDGLTIFISVIILIFRIFGIT